VKFYYATQIGTAPPTIALFVNKAHALPASYEKYLTSQLREALGFDNAPIKLVFRPRREEKARPKKAPR
jgi:GTP-binding protein